MINNERGIRTVPFRRNVSFMLLIYWAVLVAWQNIGGAEARSSIDIVIKVGLLVYFMWFYLRHSRSISVKILLVILMSFSLLITALSEPQLSFGNIITYVYPVLFLSMAYGFGDNFEINKNHLIKFCNGVIALTVYAAVYAILFRRDQFSNAFSINTAYGNELTSFFISSHEYGMYLAYAITACLICLYYKRGERFLKRLPYFISVLVLLPNLILTYSRTSIVGFLLILFVYAFFDKKSNLKKWIIFISAVVIITILLVPQIRDYIFNIVFKANNDAGRGDLIEYAINYYQSGGWQQKLFGFGINASRDYLERMTNHGSVHNTYLQVLLYYGTVGLFAMIVFLITQIIACLKEIKADRFLGSISLSILVSAMAMMFTNTAMIFNSPIDSYFLTVFAIIVPKYVRNAVRRKSF